MQHLNFVASRLLAGLTASTLLLAGEAALAQAAAPATVSVGLTAAPTTTTLPDGQTIPMWGYTCGTGAVGAPCAASNPNAGTSWSPVVITVPSGANLTINLTNNLVFGANTVPTSLVIVGQLGGGLGSGGTTTASPTHAVEQVTWPTANTGATNQGVPQLPRVQSFGTEVAAGATTALTWNNLRPGTYLIESGTHPSIQAPMGLYGVLVVTTPAAAGTPGFTYSSCAGVTANTPAAARCDSYDANVPLLMSEIDPAQNLAVNAAVTAPFFSETAVWSGQPGACGNPTTTFSASVPACYPPTVNYSPRYYLLNGVSFDRTAISLATIQTLATGAPSTGKLELNFVNAGSRMHVPSVVGLPLTLIAEDGNPAPGLPHIQNEVLLTAGKTFDALVSPAQGTGATAGTYTPATYAVFDRALGLTTNNARDGGAQGYIAVAGGAAAGGVGTTTATLSGQGNRSYYCASGTTLAVTDPALGVLGGTTGANGAAVTANTLPAGSSFAFQSNGTFIYNPPTTPVGASCAGTFTFSVNNAGAYTASIVECDANSHTGSCVVGGKPVLQNDTYTASNGQQIQIASPGILLNDSDPNGLPLKVDLTTIAASSGLKVSVNPDGSFTAIPATPCTAPATVAVPAGSKTGRPVATPGICAYSFTYNVKNEQGTAAASNATVSLNFPGGSGLNLTLVDDKNPTNIAWNITDYRWVIEEDDTMWTDPKCQVATSATSARPTDSYGHPCPPMPVESIGYNFHTANMKVIATGCVGAISCGSNPSTGFAQTVWNGTAHVPTVCDIGDGICRTDGTAQHAPLTPAQVYLDPTKHYFISVLPGDAINPTVFAPPATQTAACKSDGQVITGTFYGIAGGTAGGGPVATSATCNSDGAGGFTLSAVTVRQFSPALDCPSASDYIAGSGKCGHNLSGRQIPPPFYQDGSARPNAVTIALAETPLPTAKIAVEIYEDDYPLNGENDAGGGVDILAPNEAGLGSFQVELLDQGGQFGDNNGQPTYDMFNMPLSNGLNGTLDPSTGLNACPISDNPDNIVGMIVTCPQYESDGKTLSPLAGQAVIENLYPGLYEVSAIAGADRIARGEQWIQTNTLDGGKPHEAFVRPGEPSYFQEFGPGGFHVNMGFANPKIINDRRSNSAGTGLCDPAPNGGGLTCNSSMSGQVHGDHMARTPDERTYDTGSYDALKFSHCYVALSIPDAQTFAFTECDAAGNFSFSNLPDGVFQMAIFDQWNDIMLDGLVAAVTVSGNTVVQPTVIQWRTNVYTRTYLDLNGNGIPDRDSSNADLEPGLPFVPIHLRYRDGSIGFKMNTDLNGYASNNEVFPFMNWLVMEPDTTRFKPTGVHVIYDAGGPDDCSAANASVTGGKCSVAGSHLASTLEKNSVPPALRIPGAFYCTDADCIQAPGATNGDTAGAESILNGTYWGTVPGGRLTGPGQTVSMAANSGLVPNPATGTYLSSGRIDPPYAFLEGFQGLLGQHSFFDYGFKPFKGATAAVAATATTPAIPAAPAENGGIFGHVVYASTRPFDDPTLLVQNPWEPLVPNVTINLYQVGTDANGFTTLKLVDTTTTSSWDKWAQGFRTDGTGTSTFVQNTDGTTQVATGASNNGYVTNMNCPGQDPTSPFFQTLQGSKEWLDSADPVTGVKKTIAYDSQFKCFDGWALMNQIQPAPYDGRYQFPSVVDRDPVTGHPSGKGSLNGAVTPVAGTNCSICIANPDDGTPMLPAGKYVVEAVTPAGWSIVKEEDKNILVGDQFIAPVTQQFAGLGNVFILPDQAAMNAYYNANNAQNPTDSLGVINLPRADFNNTTDQVWPCVGAVRVVPDYLSLFPTDKQVAPFAGASRPLCDRKEVVLSDQMSANTQFFIYTETHVAGHFTGMMTNDMASEFDPFSPQFGEKFGASDLPVNMRDFMGTEMSRVYGDQWGVYNGMYMSTWEVNPPNPTGYAPQMSVACMNDPGPILDTNPASPTFGTMIVDPAYNPAYSNFCYEQMFMPGMTNYMDTPVTPVMAFADHYNLPDAELPNNTPVIKRADFAGNGIAGSVPGGTGPWSPDFKKVLTLQSVGDISVNNPNYTGPSGIAAPYNAKKLTRHYGFGTQTALSSVTVAGLPAKIVSWTDAAIMLTVPSNIPACPMQQQGYNNAQCGEVVVTAGNGLQSVSGITVTVGGKTPTLVTTAGPTSTSFGEFYPNPLQTAIDKATPGDLLIIDAGQYRENVILWKPLRLQGVGAYATTINADAQPAGKMDAWRRRVDCLFGLQLTGWTNAGNTQFNADGEPYTCPANMYFRVDRLPFEGFVGWDASSNGNLAQVLQEPSLMGAYEGAGLTVLGRGVWQPDASDLWGQGGGAGTYPAGSYYLSDPALARVTRENLCLTATTTLPNGKNGYNGAGDYGTSNYNCNPSGLDGVTVTNSSQGGGGIFLHGWTNNFQIANNRVVANAGTLAGGINVGNGEAPPILHNDNVLCGNTGVTPNPLCPPIPQNTAVPAAIPTQLQTNVHIHHNQIVDNASIGDALFSGSPAGAGGITVSSGSDNYEIDHNWIAGNLTSGDGGGMAQLGVSFNGYIHNNFVVFNEANNPTLPVDGGGIIIMGAQEDRTLLASGQECGGSTDTDCPPGIGDGTGPGLRIDSNLILGNSAAYGSGGGLRLRQTNGTEVSLFPQTPDQWYGITVTNNIIANNVAGWDGGGVSLQDSFKTVIVNNTIASNDTTASAGVLFKTLGAIDAASPPPGCLPTPDPTQPQAAGCLDPNAPHIPQPAGLVTMQNTPNMQASLVGYVNDETGAVVNTGAITCPAGFGYGDATDSRASLNNGRCILVGLPQLTNNIFWENRAFHVEIVDQNGNPINGTSTPNGTGLFSQQNIVALEPAFMQTATGQCVVPPSTLELFWDVGIRMDTLPNPNGHSLVFNQATVGSSFNLEGALTTTLGNAVSAITANPAGINFEVGDKITVVAPTSPAGQVSAVGTVSSVNGTTGAITGITLTNPGTFFGTPTAASITVTAPRVGGVLTGRVTAGVLTVTRVTSGTGPAVGEALTSNGTSIGTITASLGNNRYNISRTTLNLASGPIRYTAAPAPSGATFALVAATGSVVAATITDAGGAYVSAPTATITPASCQVGTPTSTATITLREANGLITGYTITNPGAGYTCPPIVTVTGGGLTANTSSDAGAIGLSAYNSIFSDAVNIGNVTGTGNIVPTDTVGGAKTLVAQYCNGARVPPEQCQSQQGANNQGMCLGYFTPAGISENVGVPQVFRFNGIAATATVDEGNNWINMTYGPLTLSRVPGSPGNPTTAANPYVSTTLSPTEQILTVASVGTPNGAYSLPAGSAAIGKGATTTVTTTDFYGNKRSAPYDIGAVSHTATASTGGSVSSATLTPTTASVTCNLAFGGRFVQCPPASTATFVLTNTGTVPLTGINVTSAGSGVDLLNFNISRASTCGATLAVNGTCNVVVQFAPVPRQGAGSRLDTVTVTDSAGTQTAAFTGVVQ